MSPVKSPYEVAGFVRADQPTSRRIVMAVDGPEKSGKSNFALTAPGPIGIINTDIGLDGVVQKFQNDKEIWVKNIDFRIQDLMKLSREAASDEAGKLVTALMQAYQFILGRAATAIVDNATEVWELLRIAEFGKMDHIKPHHYGSVNAKYRNFIRMAFDQEVSNLILLHKVKDEYVDDKRTGRKLRAGFADTGFLVQANISCWKDPTKPVPDKFNATIVDCRHNPSVEGLTFTGTDCNFETVRQYIFGEVEVQQA